MSGLWSFGRTSVSCDGQKRTTLLDEAQGVVTTLLPVGVLFAKDTADEMKLHVTAKGRASHMPTAAFDHHHDVSQSPLKTQDSANGMNLADTTCDEVTDSVQQEWWANLNVDVRSRSLSSVLESGEATGSPAVEITADEKTHNWAWKFLCGESDRTALFAVMDGTSDMAQLPTDAVHSTFAHQEVPASIKGRLRERTLRPAKWRRTVPRLPILETELLARKRGGLKRVKESPRFSDEAPTSKSFPPCDGVASGGYATPLPEQETVSSDAALLPTPTERSLEEPVVFPHGSSAICLDPLASLENPSGQACLAAVAPLISPAEVDVMFLLRWHFVKWVSVVEECRVQRYTMLYREHLMKCAADVLSSTTADCSGSRFREATHSP